MTYRYDFDNGANGSVIVGLDAALAFQPRSALVAEVADAVRAVLCGVGAPPCRGGDG